MSPILLLAAWLALRVPEASEADGPLDALTKHTAALWAAWRTP